MLVHQLHLQLRGGRGDRSSDLYQQRFGAAVHELGAVADVQAVLVGPAGQDGRAVRAVIVKIQLHGITPVSFPCGGRVLRGPRK